MGFSLIVRSDTHVQFRSSMTTRSGATYKPMEQQQEFRAEGTPADDRATMGTNSLPEVPNLADVIMEDRDRREREFAMERERMDRLREEDRRRYTEESERRIQDVRLQMVSLQNLVTGHTTATGPTRRTHAESIKLTRLGENDDVEAYITMFERIMEVNEVDRERWPFQLAPQLTGKAQQAYAALTPDDAKDYDVVRRAILRRYSINEETYRQRFRGLKPKEEESPQELMTRLEDLASRWTKDAMTREEVVDLLVREQFLSVLPHDVRVAVMERQPKDCSEASQFAENYLQARASSIVTGSPKTPSTKCPKCGRHGHWAPRPRNSEGRDAGSWTDSSGPKQGQLSQGPRDA